VIEDQVSTRGTMAGRDRRKPPVPTTKVGEEMGQRAHHAAHPAHRCKVATDRANIDAAAMTMHALRGSAIDAGATAPLGGKGV